MEIIELNGKYYKEHYVVMLDSYGKQSTLFLKGKKRDLLEKLEYNEKPPLHGIRDLGWQYQFLYIMSKDKIQEGDWFFSASHNKVFKCVKEDDLEHFDGDLYKIIATNNVNINEPTHEVPKYTTYAVLPKPSVRFLEYFVEKYNTYNLATKVLVEYEMKCLTLGFSDRQTNEVWTPATYDYLLKVNINNEISIDIPNLEIQRGYAQFYPNGEECTFSSNAASQICDIIVNQKTKELQEQLLEAKCNIAMLETSLEELSRGNIAMLETSFKTTPEGIVKETWDDVINNLENEFKNSLVQHQKHEKLQLFFKWLKSSYNPPIKKTNLSYK